MVWGYVAGAVAGSALDYFGNRANQDRQNQATRELWRSAPSDQMEGFRRAGLNPMLAYGRIDFPGSSANYAPSNFSPGITQAMSAAASQHAAEAQTVSAGASAKQAETQSRQVDANVRKIDQEISNLKTDQQKGEALIRNLGEEYQNLIKQGWNLTDIGNHIRAQMDNLSHQNDWYQSRSAREWVLNEIDKLELDAARGVGNFGREFQQLKPFLDLMRSIFGGRRYGN